ncbi:amino acid ABC transporter permease [Demequina lignilytica]|uniref:Amino acid ABC transporter permease n=1 Tax=Demequina lignilytica TaxID=3051663 RepID=A0AAW7M409_9MICO|nr:MULTISPECIES: amino acid ABC transporter permease [unclassified Demequina]MDN4477170.1 amino acid ABC transporter permease [Demequina sp. SYSU T00039-1]MDN4483698.1 amino acid ABC transporter permease [Demequina sp. SYSU T0a273]MDN4487343.1 amino acid ABC transporter permease [Demequina sp. SYSU T00039]MDN4491096.1 amino acid ABC transporter permease [Demequina sp. SYSU T00068]
MQTFIEEFGLIWGAFLATLSLTAVAGALSLVLGTLLATMRVSPVGPLRSFGTAYVEIVRNTPLTLMFFFWVFVAPTFGLLFPELGFWPAVVSLSLYTSSFVCEALRSGVNSVGIGQAEAARSIGLTFGQTLSQVVLPQAWRTAIPPLISVLIALTKNTSVAAGFAFTELVAIQQRLTNTHPADGLFIFFGIGLMYLVITIPLGLLAGQIERKVAFAR